MGLTEATIPGEELDDFFRLVEQAGFRREEFRLVSLRPPPGRAAGMRIVEIARGPVHHVLMVAGDDDWTRRAESSLERGVFGPTKQHGS